MNRISHDKIRAILALEASGASVRQVALAVGVAHQTALHYMRIARERKCPHGETVTLCPDCSKRFAGGYWHHQKKMDAFLAQSKGITRDWIILGRKKDVSHARS